MSEHYNDQGPELDVEGTETTMTGQPPTYPGIPVEDWESDLLSLQAWVQDVQDRTSSKTDTTASYPGTMSSASVARISPPSGAAGPSQPAESPVAGEVIVEGQSSSPIAESIDTVLNCLFQGREPYFHIALNKYPDERVARTLLATAAKAAYPILMKHYRRVDTVGILSCLLDPRFNLAYFEENQHGQYIQEMYLPLYVLFTDLYFIFINSLHF
jgi:hypothetical protein